MTPAGAVVFELEGVLLDSAAVESDLVRRLRERFPTTAGAGHHGPGRQEAVDRIIGEGAHAAEDVRAYSRYLDELLESAAIGGGIRVVRGAERLVRGLHERDVSLGIVTPVVREHVAILLGDLLGCFSQLMAGSDVVTQRPLPEAFAEIAWQLGVVPERCVAVVASPGGLEAARLVGMRVVAVRPAGVESLPPLAALDPDALLRGTP